MLILLIKTVRCRIRLLQHTPLYLVHRHQHFGGNFHHKFLKQKVSTPEHGGCTALRNTAIYEYTVIWCHIPEAMFPLEHA